MWGSGKGFMTKRRLIYEGKAKILYEGPEPGTVIQYFKDDITAFNREKTAIFEGKGVLNNRISEYIMRCLQDTGIPTHFIRRLNMREQLVHRVEIVPVEVVVRNAAAGSLCKRYGIPEGRTFREPLVEFFFKNDALHDPMVTPQHVAVFGWASEDEIEDMISLSLRINDILSGLFTAIGIRLVDFKLEYGRRPGYPEDYDYGGLVLADEISPDSCRLRDTRTGRVLDKDRFRNDLGDVTEAYAEVARRLGIIMDQSGVEGDRENVTDLPRD